MNLHSNMANRQKGFTILEILIAISIMSLIVVTTYSSLSKLSTSKKYLDEERESFLIANSILKRITRELQMISNKKDLLDPQGHTDIYQDQNDNADLDLVGKSQQLANDKHGDIITFIASEAGQYVPDGKTHAGFVQITYRVASDPKNPDSERFSLIRDETPLLDPPEKAYENTMTFPLTENLSSFTFNYYNSEEMEWRKNWPEELLALPQKIALKIEILTASGQIRRYRTVIPVHGEQL